MNLAFANFQSFHGEHQIPIEPGCWFLLGDNQDGSKVSSNGAGKTTTCSLIPWALLGKTHMGVEKDDIIHREADAVSVELEMTDLWVKRTKERGHSERLEFMHRGKRCAEASLAETQRALSKVLGISDRLFFNSIWIAKDSRSVRFLSAPPAERLSLLEEMLENEQLALGRKRALDVRRQAESDLAGLQSKMEMLRSEEEKQRQRLLRAQEQYQDAARTLNVQQHQRANQRNDLSKRIADLTVDLLSPPKVAPEGLALEYSVAKALADKLSLQVHTLDTQAHLRIQESCPMCRRAFDPSDVEKLYRTRNQAQEELDVTNLSLQNTRGEVRRLEDALVAYRGRSLETDEKKRQLEDLKRRLIEAENADQGESPLVAFRRVIDDSKAAIDGLQGTIAEMERHVQRKAAEIPDLKFWEKAFGPQGIRNLLLDDLRSLMSHHVNQYALDLAGDAIRVEFPQSDRGFVIMLHTPIGSADLHTFSTGEVWRASLVVLLAIRKTLTYLQQTDLDLLILDDATGTLDEAGELALVELGPRLAEEFGTVLITLPREHKSIPPDRVIRVRKSCYRSEIIRGRADAA